MDLIIVAMRNTQDGRIDEHLPLKPLDLSLLLVLSEGDQYGYGLVKRIAQPEAGGIRLAPSNLYYVLDRMMAAGLVRERDAPAGEGEEDGMRRRWYGITALGRAVLGAETRRLSAVIRTAERLRVVGGGGT